MGGGLKDLKDDLRNIARGKHSGILPEGCEVILPPAEVVVYEGCIHKSGGDRAYLVREPCGLQLGAQGLREAFHGEFGGSVKPPSGRNPVTAERGDIHDAPSLWVHHLEGLLGAYGQPPNIHFPHLIPIAYFALKKAGEVGDSCVIDENVDARNRLFQDPKGVGNAGRLTEVT